MSAHEGKKPNRMAIAGLILCLAPAGVCGAGSMTQAEADGYQQWLHSLEQVVAARAQDDGAQGDLLYPSGAPGWAALEARPYRHLAICKALMVLEDQYGDRARDQVTSTLVALANARNYANLSEFDRALSWYSLADNLDPEGEFRREIRLETLATAAAAGDSAAFMRVLAGALSTADPAAHVGEFVLGARWAMGRGDAGLLRTVQEAMAAVDSAGADPTLLFWRAYGYSVLGEYERSLEDLRELILYGGLSLGLSESQRAWVLTSLADGFFLEGDLPQAGEMYRSLKESLVPELQAWGAFQLAGLDFLDHRFGEAAAGYAAVCGADRSAAWQEQACAMATLAGELDRIRSEGEPYGTARFYAP